ncbi:WXG100 family type VII secretion target [Nocardioides albus]|uniref:Uncharacterized protein YukE n=1 Tax=Nocardioides albus TaxID=1841 RepID=A0A7W5FB12_9ACTN|nr:WXG100 family type VII secretion target [Nocardioides albus]MBB3091721.1 uncharacterized protein YukE [Nocardioides albus]GGU44382.1 hypothetical protein GCM10007979_49300 [Nocardioides albus]
MGEIRIVIGQQTQAAKLVEARIKELQGILTGLGGKLDEATETFKGSAAQGFGEAITEWFENTAKLGEQMAEYAGGLYAIDLIHQGNDEGTAAGGRSLEDMLSSQALAKLDGRS